MTGRVPAAVALVASGLLAWLFAGPVAAVVVAVTAGCLYRAGGHARRRHHQARVRARAEDLLAAVAAELDAGGPPAVALHAAASGVLATARRAVAIPGGGGRPGSGWIPLDRLAAALAAADDPGDVLCASEAGSVRQLGIAYRVCTRAGARLAPVAEMLAALARSDAVRAAELSAALAGPRASGRLVAALPIAGIALGSLTGTAVLHTLLATPAGVACLLIGGLADLVGLRWLRAFADGVQRRAGPVAVDAHRLDVTGGDDQRRARARPDAGARRARLLADLPLALDLIAAALRSGATLGAAFVAVGSATGGELGEQLRAAARALAAGADVPSACADLVAATQPRHRLDLFGRWKWCGPRGSPSSRWPTLAQTAVTAFDRAHRSGARPAAALTRLAERARAESHAETIAAARRAGVLAVAPLGLCFLPAFLLISVVPLVLGTLPALLPAQALAGT